MKFRTSPLLAIAALLAVSAAAPAMAGDFDMGGIPVVGPVIGGSTSNSLNATNVAAGIGNEADQDLHLGQKGGPGFGPVTNSFNALNLAAGIGNLATQNIHSRQK